MSKIIILISLVLTLFCAVSLSDANINPLFLSNPQFANIKYRHYKNLLSPDACVWLTERFFLHLSPGLIDTIDVAQAEFDSLDYGMDADTCWIDSLVMNKEGDSLSGFYYIIYEDDGFHYNLNQRYTFRVKGKASIPTFTDTMRSVQNNLPIIFPQVNDTIYRGKDLIVQWTPYNEHNILIELVDFSNNILFYYPVLDIGSFTIPSTDIDSLTSGPIVFVIGRMSFKIEFNPGFPVYAITALIHQMLLELQNAQAITENINHKQNVRLIAPLGKSYITYNFAEPLPIQLTLYDVKGNKIREISEPPKSNGTIYWDNKDTNGKPVSKGIYFYNLKVDKETYRGKFMIIN
ncbi:MAG: T9SS type A sorting domain-containing protein [candidate division WOR-3 bacterium]